MQDTTPRSPASMGEQWTTLSASAISMYGCGTARDYSELHALLTHEDRAAREQGRELVVTLGEAALFQYMEWRGWRMAGNQRHIWRFECVVRVGDDRIIKGAFEVSEYSMRVSTPYGQVATLIDRMNQGEREMFRQIVPLILPRWNP